MEEEDLNFTNSIHCPSYFQSFKRFPGHQSELRNAQEPPANSRHAGQGHCLLSSWPTDNCWHQPQWIQGEKGGEKTSPKISIKIMEPTPGPLVSQCPLARTLSPILTYLFSSLFFITEYIFFYSDFFLPQGNCTTSRNGPDPKSSLYTQQDHFGACACYRCYHACVAKGITILTLSSAPGPSQTSTDVSNQCGHVNITASTKDVKPTPSEAQLLMAWVHIG